MATRFRRAFRALVPTWLGGGPDPRPGEEDDGRLVLYSLGVLKDAFVERARLGLINRFPEYAVPSALSLIGRDRRMRRGRGESDAAWARRLVQWRYPRGHRVRGNPFALLSQIRAYINAPVRVRTVDRRGNWYEIAADGTESFSWDLGNWEWGTLGSDWSRFWVIIYSTGPSTPWQKQAKFGAVGLKFGQSNKHIGTTATDADHSAIATIVREWKPAGTMQETVIVSFDDSLFDPDDPSTPTEQWEQYSENTAGVQSPLRSSNARYWYVRPQA